MTRGGPNHSELFHVIPMSLFCIVGSLLALCGDVELNPGPGLSECVYTSPAPCTTKHIELAYSTDIVYRSKSISIFKLAAKQMISIIV